METLDQTPAKNGQPATMPVRYREANNRTKKKAVSTVQKKDPEMQPFLYSYPKNGLAGLL